MYKKSQIIIFITLFTLMIIFSYFFIDIPIAEFFYHQRETYIYKFSKSITDFAKAEYQLIPALIFYFYFRKKNRYYANIALLIFISVAISGLTSDIVKFIIGRYRPIEYFENHLYGIQFFQTKARYTSIPSGHTTTIFSAMYLLSIFFKKYRYFFLGFGLFMGLTRITTINHYPSDVLAGIFVAISISHILFIKFKKSGAFEQYEKSIST